MENQNKENKVIIFCPIADTLVVQNGEKFAQKMLQNMYEGFNDIVKLQGSNPLQNIICSMDDAVPISPAIQVATIVVDKEHEHVLHAFAQKNNMQLMPFEIPPPDLKNNIFHFLAIALLDIQSKWDRNHEAKNVFYYITEEDVFGQVPTLKIRGFILHDVKIALEDTTGVPISAVARLSKDPNISVRFTDLAAFGNPGEVREKLATGFDLYNLVADYQPIYDQTGDLHSPCAEIKYSISDHLKGISWTGKENDTICAGVEVRIEQSQSLMMLKIDENGLYAHAETQGLYRLGSLGGHIRPNYVLEIKSGLILEIFSGEQRLFIAYVPQEEFKLEEE